MIGKPLVPYVGPSKNVIPGSNIDYPREFVPHETPEGLRNMIAVLEIECTGNFDSVTTAIVEGEDLSDLCKHALLKDKAGRLVDLDGYELRQHMFDAFASLAPDDPADQAISASAATGVYRHYIPFAYPRLSEPTNTSLAADIFRAEDFVLNLKAPTNSELQQSSGSYVLNASTGVTFRLIAWCYGERTFEEKSRITVLSQSTEADDRFPITRVANRPMLAAWLSKAGINGGADFSNIDTIDSMMLGYRNVQDIELEHAYRMARPGGIFEYSKDPFDHVETSDAAGANAFPLLITPHGTKISKLRVFGSAPEIEVGESSAITDKKVVKVYLTPPSREDTIDAAKHRRVDLSKLRVKTLTGKAVALDDPLAAFLPKKVTGRVSEYR